MKVVAYHQFTSSKFFYISFSDGLVICHLPFGPTAYFTLSNTVMRHDVPDIGTMSEAYPHLVFHNFTSKLGERVGSFFLELLFVTFTLWAKIITLLSWGEGKKTLIDHFTVVCLVACSLNESEAGVDLVLIETTSFHMQIPTN